VNQALTRRAFDANEMVIDLMDDADADDVWDRDERHMIRSAVIDVRLLIRSADQARALGMALQGGIACERYRMRLVDAAFTAFDELPEPPEDAA
jgi:hypothetical protein